MARLRHAGATANHFLTPGTCGTTDWCAAVLHCRAPFPSGHRAAGITHQLPTNPPTLGKNLQISTLNVATGTASPHISAASSRTPGANVLEDGEFSLSRTAITQTGAVIPPTGVASLHTGGKFAVSATTSTRTGAAILPTAGASLHIPGQNPENGLSTPQKPGRDCLLNRGG